MPAKDGAVESPSWSDKSSSQSLKSASSERAGTVKGIWSREEDEILVRLVEKMGPRDWKSIMRAGLPHRTSKSCRLRWYNHLDPKVKKTPFTSAEDKVIVRAYDELGSKWSAIARLLPGRTDNAIKNYWHSSLKKKRTGIRMAMFSEQLHQQDSARQSTVNSSWDNMAFLDQELSWQAIVDSTRTSEPFAALPVVADNSLSADTHQIEQSCFEHVAQEVPMMTLESNVDNSSWNKLQGNNRQWDLDLFELLTHSTSTVSANQGTQSPSTGTRGGELCAITSKDVVNSRHAAAVSNCQSKSVENCEDVDVGILMQECINGYISAEELSLFLDQPSSQLSHPKCTLDDLIHPHPREDVDFSPLDLSTYDSASLPRFSFKHSYNYHLAKQARHLLAADAVPDSFFADDNIPGSPYVTDAGFETLYHM